MKITNFKPELINKSKELNFFDGCLVEYFEGTTFSLFGSVELRFEEGEFDFCLVEIMVAQDENKRIISLSSEIKKNIEQEIESLIENFKNK